MTTHGQKKKGKEIKRMMRDSIEDYKFINKQTRQRALLSWALRLPIYGIGPNSGSFFIIFCSQQSFPYSLAALGSRSILLGSYKVAYCELGKDSRRAEILEKGIGSYVMSDLESEIVQITSIRKWAFCPETKFESPALLSTFALLLF